MTTRGPAQFKEAGFAFFGAAGFDLDLLAVKELVEQRTRPGTHVSGYGHKTIGLKVRRIGQPFEYMRLRLHLHGIIKFQPVIHAGSHGVPVGKHTRVHVVPGGWKGGDIGIGRADANV